MLSVVYAECRLCWVSQTNPEGRYAWCHNAECHYAECRGAEKVAKATFELTPARYRDPHAGQWPVL